MGEIPIRVAAYSGCSVEYDRPWTGTTGIWNSAVYELREHREKGVGKELPAEIGRTGETTGILKPKG